jgi:hypothetical protein
VPTDFNSPGHVDHPPPAVVFPPDAGVLARPTERRCPTTPATATCTSLLPRVRPEPPPGHRPDRSTRTPRFNGGPGQAALRQLPRRIPPQTPGHPRRDPHQRAPTATRTRSPRRGTSSWTRTGNSTSPEWSDRLLGPRTPPGDRREDELEKTSVGAARLRVPGEPALALGAGRGAWRRSRRSPSWSSWRSSCAGMQVGELRRG